MILNEPPSTRARSVVRSKIKRVEFLSRMKIKKIKNRRKKKHYNEEIHIVVFAASSKQPPVLVL